jgi:hypothetical protein
MPLNFYDSEDFFFPSFDSVSPAAAPRRHPTPAGSAAVAALFSHDNFAAAISVFFFIFKEDVCRLQEKCVKCTSLSHDKHQQFNLNTLIDFNQLEIGKK